MFDHLAAQRVLTAALADTHLKSVQPGGFENGQASEAKDVQELGQKHALQ